MQKRLLVMVLLCTVVFGMFSGCAKKESLEKVKESPLVITAMIQQSRNFEGLQKMIQKLEQEENIKIDAQIVPDAESLNIIKMKLNSGSCPDIIDYNVPAIYDIVDPAANFADLTAEQWVSKLLIPGNVTAKDGKIYGFPFLSVPGMHGFIYNKEVFEKAGLRVPNTWTELLDACEKLKAKGITPLFIPKDSWVPQILMTDNYAKELGIEGCKKFAEKIVKNEVKWTDIPQFSQVIDTYLDLYKKGFVNDNFVSATYDDAILAVAEGKAAMHFNGDFFAASVLQANPAAKIGMFALSMKDDIDIITENMSSTGFVAYKNSKNLDLVKKVFNLWSAPEYADLYFTSRSAFPAFQGVNGGTVPDYLVDINEKFIKQGKAIPEFNFYVMSMNALFESSLYVYYVEAPAKRNIDGKGIMAKFQKDFEQYMKDQGAKGF